MDNKVRVVSDDNGNVINVSEKSPEYGYVRVEQNASTISTNGWLRLTKRSSLIKGKVEDLVKAGFKDGSALPGKLVVVESFEPFDTNNPERDLKFAGVTGVVCRVDDQPIYRQTVYTTNPDAQDQLIMHNNAEEIREVQAASRAMSSLLATDANL